ncbi:sperm acrosome-associated protein 7-like [Cricetulus griseus]|uniref:Sperm acrosome-associated protein 7-like n=1 Tax=Cricetulus griseus TaxID=10029 RepID=A0A9J7HDM3_CRIGR|nr:sperm acrosome-associated protein 7-like [Cricetulus griseus]XP_035316226.1 sperm acrosome-associated protein 7-like [Cricetulus griseus]
MAANRGAGTFVSFFLLCCWQDVQPWPNRELSGSKTEQQPSLKILDDDIASVFDEILSREILEPGKSSYFQIQNPSTTLESKSTKDKNDEKETLFQMKSLEALEKIIDTIRRAIGTHLKKKRKFQKSRRIRQLLGKLI